MQMSMFSLEEPPAKASAWPDFARDLMTRAEISCSPSLQSLHDMLPDGSFGRTSPASCPVTEEGILAPSSGRWGNSGMGGPIVSWTLNTSEHPASHTLSHSDGVVCSLSDILETGDVPRRYFLSQKACAGILRRAAKRGRCLPPSLQTALEHAAQTTTKRKRDT